MIVASRLVHMSISVINLKLRWIMFPVWLIRKKGSRSATTALSLLSTSNVLSSMRQATMMGFAITLDFLDPRGFHLNATFVDIEVKSFLFPYIVKWNVCQAHICIIKYEQYKNFEQTTKISRLYSICSHRSMQTTTIWLVHKPLI